MKEIAVLGCGVSGLTTAVRLIENDDVAHSVRIIARERNEATTSSKAGALWFPYAAEPWEQVCGWSRTGYRVFEELACEPGHKWTEVSMVKYMMLHVDFTELP